MTDQPKWMPSGWKDKAAVDYKKEDMLGRWWGVYALARALGASHQEARATATDAVVVRKRFKKVVELGFEL